jgi:hypothetical protein
MMFLSLKIKTQFLIGPIPIPALTCPDTPELDLPSNHSLGYGFRSSPAFSRICPASSSGILVQYAG